MTEQPAADVPVPVPPVPQIPPPAPVPTMAPGPQPLSAAEESQLGELLARQSAAALAAGGVRMKVEPPHSLFTFGGYSIGPDFVSVPANVAPALMESAADAGVTITQEQEG